jgi:WD repeat-containing protein 19
MRPEYRDDIPEAFKQKIEKFVRRPSNEEEVESSSACPYCAFSIPDSLLDCPSCRNSIPYCITTGRHMVLDDWTVCPSCRFPTLHSAFTEAIQQEKVCPMCEQEIELSQIAKIAMTAEQLMAANADPEEEGAEKPEDA